MDPFVGFYVLFFERWYPLCEDGEDVALFD